MKFILQTVPAFSTTVEKMVQLSFHKNLETVSQNVNSLSERNG
jgi:hypothetical protein